MESVPPA